MMPEKSTLAGCAAAYGAVLIWSASYTVKAPTMKPIYENEDAYAQRDEYAKAYSQEEANRVSCGAG